MSLLDQEVKKEEPKGKKIVLFLLILSIFVMIMIIVMMMALSEKQSNSGLSVKIDSADIVPSEGLLTVDENGVQYISIQKIAKSIGYNYLTGEYKQYNEDTTNTKCYLESTDRVIQFEGGSKIVYKISPASNLDYEQYELTNKILKQNNLLYVALDDVDVALDLICSKKENVILIKTVETLNEEYKTTVPKQTNNLQITVSDDFNNKKTIPHDMIVVSNEAGKWGVVKSSDFSTIIGNKYSTIEYIEQGNVFIVSDDNKYGVINNEGKIIIDLNYESIKVINNNPLCYEIKSGQKLAIVNEKGMPITNNLYESIGCNSQNNDEGSVIAIKKFGENKINLLVVCKNQKYGFINLDKGTSIGDCVLDKVYLKTENGKKVYYVQVQEQEILLDKYLEYINTTTVNVGQ